MGHELLVITFAINFLHNKKNKKIKKKEKKKKKIIV